MTIHTGNFLQLWLKNDNCSPPIKVSYFQILKYCQSYDGSKAFFLEEFNGYTTLQALYTVG